LADPDKKAAYRLAAREKNRSEWNLAIGDALIPPTIIEIDPRGSGKTVPFGNTFLKTAC
jgi:hypothetical protein